MTFRSMPVRRIAAELVVAGSLSCSKSESPTGYTATFCAQRGKT